ncbi:hypothetical protein ABT56_22435 [Photobacterium aquae]|uniref:AAA domain-containing protein n=1 Tax=Photobacterium aquae TaxID=1195763 RepID=A0A0J1JGC8_9GAMM|nr:ParA family protein [Photobacterium aquae]KLV00872.1 hypothetical protein ABT56_22435 [Photobacterium aquae]
MNAQSTLRTLITLAATAKENTIKQNSVILDGADAPNGLFYRQYNTNEARKAVVVGDIPLTYGRFKSVCQELNISCIGNNTIVDIRDINIIRDHLYPESRQKKVRNKAAIYAVSNLKGGTGKSTTTATLATGLCTEIVERKFRVLIIDLDPQASQTSLFFPNFDNESELTIGDIVCENYIKNENQTDADIIRSCVKETNIPNLHVLPASENDRNVELFTRELLQKNPQYPVHKLLEPIISVLSEDYDVILIDTPPTFNNLMLAAHYSADNIIVPVRPSKLDTDSTEKYLEFLARIYGILVELGHKGYKHINVLPTAVNETSKTQVRIANSLRAASPYNSFANNFIYSEAVLRLQELKGTIYSYSLSQGLITRTSLKNAQDSCFMLISVLAEQLFEQNEADQ